MGEFKDSLIWNASSWCRWNGTHESKGKSIIGASLSEPHIDEFAVKFPYIYICIPMSYVVL